MVVLSQELDFDEIAEEVGENATTVKIIVMDNEDVCISQQSL